MNFAKYEKENLLKKCNKVEIRDFEDLSLNLKNWQRIFYSSLIITLGVSLLSNYFFESLGAFVPFGVIFCLFSIFRIGYFGRQINIFFESIYRNKEK